MSMADMRVLSGIRSSGILHIGNYLGALRNWKTLQQQYECYYFIADWHALTTDYADTQALRQHMLDNMAGFLAVGLDPERCTLFIQSRVPEHAELHLLLSMITPVPWLERVPSYKEQQQQIKEKDLTTYGFLGYPVLQTADIIIYKAHYVPVGIDQVPHIELSRDIARRFNHMYAPVFPEPQPLLTETPKVPGLDGRKMSKSYNNAIYLTDPPAEIESKIKVMMTDPARKRRSDPGNPDVCPVFDFHKVYSSPETVALVDRECRTAGIGCIDCKKMMSTHLLQEMGPILEQRRELEQHPQQVIEVFEEGSKKAQQTARATMAEVREAMKLL
jgi:tryptophanyl-tRNA synthetase